MYHCSIELYTEYYITVLWNSTGNMMYHCSIELYTEYYITVLWNSTGNMIIIAL